jgi:hypothetical protein
LFENVFAIGNFLETFIGADKQKSIFFKQLTVPLVEQFQFLYGSIKVLVES